MANDVSIIIPTYNERDNIRLLLPAIMKQLGKRVNEIIVVDDSSPDETGEVVLQLAKSERRIRLISRSKPEGIGAALQAGYAAAKGQVILSSDADLAFPVHEMLDLLSAIESGADLAIGSRHLPGGHYERKATKTVMKHRISSLGNWLAARLTGIQVHDFSANFRAIRQSSWQKLHLTEKGNSWLGEMIIAAHFAGLTIKEVPVSFHDRRHGHSKNRLLTQVPKFFYSLLRNRFKGASR